MLAGGVVRDAAFQKQSLKQLREVLGAKAVAAERVSEISGMHPTQIEVSFSSLSALLGTIGQANYAAANMALNELASSKQVQGKASDEYVLCICSRSCPLKFKYEN